MSAPDQAVSGIAGRTTNGLCQACQKEMPFVMPMPRIFNEVDVSVLAIAHPPSRCPHCQAIHLPLIHGISAEGVFELTWKLAKINRGPIIPGSDSTALRDAIQAAQFNDKLKKGSN
jgi:hypothetical protein